MLFGAEFISVFQNPSHNTYFNQKCKRTNAENFVDIQKVCTICIKDFCNVISSVSIWLFELMFVKIKNGMRLIFFSFNNENKSLKYRNNEKNPFNLFRMVNESRIQRN